MRILGGLEEGSLFGSSHTDGFLFFFFLIRREATGG